MDGKRAAEEALVDLTQDSDDDAQLLPASAKKTGAAAPAGPPRKPGVVVGSGTHAGEPACAGAGLRLCGRRDGAAGLQGVPLRSAPSCRGAGRSGERVGIHTYICIGVRRTVRTRQQLSLIHVHTGTPRRLDEMRRDCKHLALRRRRAPQEAS